jgi:hypothetical protein
MFPQTEVFSLLFLAFLYHEQTMYVYRQALQIWTTFSVYFPGFILEYTVNGIFYLNASKQFYYYYYYYHHHHHHLWLCSPARAMASSSTRFLDHTQRRATVGMTPLDECSARRRDFYLTTYNTQQTNINAPDGIRTRDRSWRAAVDLRLIPRGHWDRL